MTCSHPAVVAKAPLSDEYERGTAPVSSMHMPLPTYKQGAAHTTHNTQHTTHTHTHTHMRARAHTYTYSSVIRSSAPMHMPWPTYKQGSRDPKVTTQHSHVLPFLGGFAVGI